MNHLKKFKYMTGKSRNLNTNLKKKTGLTLKKTAENTLVHLNQCMTKTNLFCCKRSNTTIVLSDNRQDLTIKTENKPVCIMIGPLIPISRTEGVQNENFKKYR